MSGATALWSLVLCSAVPAVAGFLFAAPQYKRFLLGLMVFLICYVKKPFYQELFYVSYRGVDRGFGVTLCDLLFLGFFLWIILGGQKKKIRWLPFNSLPWFLLIGWSILSLTTALNGFIGLFTIHKFIRCWILYFVIVNTVRDRKDLVAVILGLTFSIYFQGLNVFWAKYVTGAVTNRAVGTFRHPNTLAMYINLVGPLLLSVLLTNELKPKTNKLIMGAIITGIICVIFTKSRAAIVLHPTGLGLAAGISFLQKPTTHKAGLLTLGMIAVLILGSMALPRVIRRFQNAPEESMETRVLFNDAAKAMAHDNFFGIGINCYSMALSNTDYYWYVYPEYVDVDDPEAFRETKRGQSRLGTAHHIYLLYAAEIGWIGMGIFMMHCALFWFYNLTAWLRAKNQVHKAIFLGLIISTSIHHAHGTLEWVFRQTEILYFFFALMGLMVAAWNQETTIYRPKRPRTKKRNMAGTTKYNHREKNIE